MLLELGIILDHNNNNIDIGILFGITMHCFSLAIGIETFFLFFLEITYQMRNKGYIT